MDNWFTKRLCQAWSVFKTIFAVLDVVKKTLYQFEVGDDDDRLLVKSRPLFG